MSLCVCRRSQKPNDRLRTAAIRHMKEHDNRTILSPPNKLLFQMVFGLYVCVEKKLLLFIENATIFSLTDQRAHQRATVSGKNVPNPN